MEKEGLIMCYKYWYPQEMLSDASRDAQDKPRRAQVVEEDEAMKRAKEVIEKARSAKPAPAGEPVTSDKEKEAVPA
jgi:archaellum component FlaD/FlaE